MGNNFIPMEASPVSLVGFRGLRGAALVAVKKAQPITAGELAAQFGLTPNALRRHLKALEDEGLVRYRRESRGVGGPVFAYSLTAEGEALFPRTYAPALAGALEVLREQLGSEGMIRFFRAQWTSLLERSGPAPAGLPLEERAQLLAELLSSQGYMAEAESRSPTEATIREHNCAVRAIAERFPEVCAAEAQFLEEVLGAEVEREQHILSGCNACQYTVHAGTVSAQSVPRRTIQEKV
jgi:DeoR family suf operon transcriptional repressor